MNFVLFFILSLALPLFYLMLSFVVVFLFEQCNKKIIWSLVHSFSYLAPLFVLTLFMSHVSCVVVLLDNFYFYLFIYLFVCLFHAREKEHLEPFMLFMELVWWLEHTKLHSLQHMVSIRMEVIHHPFSIVWFILEISNAKFWPWFLVSQDFQPLKATPNWLKISLWNVFNILSEL
jgi:hypothetical protein